MDWMNIILTYVLPVVAGLIGWFCPQPGKKGVKNTFIDKVGGIDLWLPLINRLQKEYSSKAFNIILQTVKDVMSHKKDERHPAAIQKAQSELLKKGENISLPTLKTLIEVAVDKVKSLD